MDLNAYLLDGVVEATAPPNETAVAARTRADAIVEMIRAFDPRDAMETMIACHCVMLQFLLNAAMRAACDVRVAPAVLTKNRAAATSISRTLHQWVTKFEKVRKRNEASAAAVREGARSPAALVSAAPPAAVESSVPTSPVAPTTPPREPADKLVIHPPLPGAGAAGTVTAPPDVVIAAAVDALARSPRQPPAGG
jgi:hypothetical protein